MVDHGESKLSGIEGVVKWFDARLGFGFIIGPEGQDIFVHFSVIEDEGFRTLKDGAAVLYDAVRSEKGWKATRAEKLGNGRLGQPLAARAYARSPRRTGTH